jgi:membrane protein implicated in regulation of membrane protease activity
MLTIWIVAGAVLIALEVVVPGMVLGFLGASALFIAVFIWLGWIVTWVAALTIFFVLSLVLLIGLRGIFQRFVGGDVERQSPDEDLDAYGTLVDVVETITPEQPGRIRYREVTWQASCSDSTLETGSQAVLVYRDNLVWVVESTPLPATTELT